MGLGEVRLLVLWAFSKFREGLGCSCVGAFRVHGGNGFVAMCCHYTRYGDNMRQVFRGLRFLGFWGFRVFRG